MTAILSLNLLVRLLLELAALAALAYWGFRAGHTLPARLALGLGAPLLAAAIWGQFVSPRAAVQVSAVTRLLLEALVLGGGAAALAAAGSPGPASILAAVAVVNRVLMAAWHQ